MSGGSVDDYEHYIDFFENATVPMHWVGPDGTVLHANQAELDALGYTRDEYVGHHIADFHADQVVIDDILERLSAGEALRNYEARMVCKDGSIRHVLINSSVNQEDGQFINTRCVTRDITERKEEEQKRARRYEAIFNQTYQFTGLMEPDGTLIEANQTALEFGGLAPEDVLDKPFWEASWWQRDEETQEELRDAIDRAADGEFVRYDVEVQGDDETILIDFSIRPVTDDAGDVEFLIPEGRNITELKSLQKRKRELAAIREQMEFALDSTDSIIWSIDLETEESTDYGPTEQVFGIEPTGIASFLEQVVHPDDQADVEHVFDAIRQGKTNVFDVEYRTVSNGGEAKWVASEGYVQDGTTEHPSRLVGLATDITDRKQREAELTRQNERLDEFASIVSHDLRNPLSVAQGRLEQVKDEVEHEHLDTVERGLDRMEALVTGLLTLAREEEKSVDLESVDLAEITERCWRTADTATASLVVGVDVSILADRARVQQLLENLFRNAVEHGGTDITITVGTLSDGFYVADDGPGIPEAEREDVFTAGHSTTEEGTGFGLNIVKEICEAHDWAIRVTDSKDGGAQFEITDVEVTNC